MRLCGFYFPRISTYSVLNAKNRLLNFAETRRLAFLVGLLPQCIFLFSCVPGSTTMSLPGHHENVLKQSRDFIRKQKYSEAAELLQNLLAADPNSEDAWELLGMARFFAKQLEPARVAFEQLTKLNSGHALGWVNLGAVLNRMGDYKKAIESLRRAIQKNRKCAEAYYNMGIAQRGLQLNTMAISAYKEAIKLKPDLIEAHLNLGNIYVEVKNLSLALLCFQTAAKLDPSSPKAKACLEKARQAQKDARRAESPFGRLVDVEQLDQQQQQVMSGPRVLNATQRIHERELVQNVTRRVRVAAKEVVPLLDDTLHAELHRLERIVLQNDAHLSSPERLQQFSQTLNELQRLRAVISSGLGELRIHQSESGLATA